MTNLERLLSFPINPKNLMEHAPLPRDWEPRPGLDLKNFPMGDIAVADLTLADLTTHLKETLSPDLGYVNLRIGKFMGLPLIFPEQGGKLSTGTPLFWSVGDNDESGLSFHLTESGAPNAIQFLHNNDQAKVGIQTGSYLLSKNLSGVPNQKSWQVNGHQVILSRPYLRTVFFTGMKEHENGTTIKYDISMGPAEVPQTIGTIDLVNLSYHAPTKDFTEELTFNIMRVGNGYTLNAKISRKFSESARFEVSFDSSGKMSAGASNSMAFQDKELLSKAYPSPQYPQLSPFVGISPYSELDLLVSLKAMVDVLNDIPSPQQLQAKPPLYFVRPKPR